MKKKVDGQCKLGYCLSYDVFPQDADYDVWLLPASPHCWMKTTSGLAVRVFKHCNLHHKGLFSDQWTDNAWDKLLLIPCSDS